MDRNFIERMDFPAARKGWDPDAVRAHLRMVADAAEEAVRRSVPSTAAEQAGEQVRAIVEVAESSADDIVRRAQNEADELVSQARAEANATRERAEAAAAKHLQDVEAAGQRLQERAAATEADFETMLANLRSAGDGLLDRLRGGAGEIQGRVEAILGSLPDLTNWDEEDEPDEPDEEGFDDGEDAAEDDGSDELDDAPTDDPGARIAAEHELAEVVPDLDPAEAGGGNGNAADAEESARIVALNMALSGTPRDETATYLADNFEVADAEAILDEVYARVS